MARRPVLASVTSSLAAILILAAGCSDSSSPTAVQLEPAVVSSVESPVGQKANVVRANFRAGTYSAIIGPEGGVLEFGIGKITFPAGAVDQATSMTAETDGHSLAVRFGPHGLTFNTDREPVLSMYYAGTGVNPRKLQIHYVDDSHHVLETLPAVIDIKGQTISSEVRHYSVYATAGG